jgi:hypothetical protein
LIAVVSFLPLSVFFVSRALYDMWSYRARKASAATTPPLYWRGMPVAHFDPDRLTDQDWMQLRSDFIERSVPFVLRRAGGATLSTYEPPPHAMRGIRAGMVRTVFDFESYYRHLPGISEAQERLFPGAAREAPPLWLVGGYKSVGAHMDATRSTFNMLFVKQGCKDVVIVPREETERLEVVSKVDRIMLSGDMSLDSRAWTADLKSYWHVVLEPQSLLVYNLNGCIHHFINEQVGDEFPVAVSVRPRTWGTADPRVMWLLLTSPPSWWAFCLYFGRQLMQVPNWEENLMIERAAGGSEPHARGHKPNKDKRQALQVHPRGEV